MSIDLAGRRGEPHEMISATRPGPRFASLAAAAVLCLAAACVATTEHAPPSEAIHLGSVLPFSGARAASGAAMESALRLAIDQVNRAGGLGGRPLWLDVADSHSDEARATANALALIGAEPMPFFIGTEEPKTTYQISSAIKDHQMVHVLPGLTSPRFHDPSAMAAWFRLSPSGAFIACALAKHMLKAGVTKVSVVIDPDDYSSSFATMFGLLLSTKGGTMLPTLQLQPGATSYTDMLSSIERMAPGAVALITSPSTAAGFLQEWAVRGKPVSVYLGPTLNSPELLRNVPGGVLEGMSGVSADLGQQAARFQSFFETQTALPDTAGAHYYFDAVALLALAATRGMAQTGSLPLPATMMQHMLDVTSPGGTPVAFDQLATGLPLVARGEKIEYQGAAGNYVLNAVGDSTYNRGAIWQISGTEFVTIEYEQCEVAELQTGSRTTTEF
jgi:ABC-type branched-subunit amino acid transport system substrate-binding protein